MRIIALEEHFATPGLVEGLGAWLASYPQWVDPLLDIGDGRVAAMDAAGIDTAVLSLTAPGVEQLEGPEAVKLARESNDVLGKAVREHSGRLAGFATVPVSGMTGRRSPTRAPRNCCACESVGGCLPVEGFACLVVEPFPDSGPLRGWFRGTWTKVLIVVVGNMSTTTRGGVDETFTHRGFNAPVTISADELANTMVDFFQEITLSIPGAQVLRNDGVVAGISGVPSPAMNSVWLLRPDPEVADVASLLGEVAVRAVPFSLRLRPGSGTALAEPAAGHGMTAAGEVPLMAVGAAADIRSPDELSIRLLAPGEAAVHARLCTAGFGLPDDIARRIVTEGTLKSSAVRCYVGELAGQPVTTGLTITTGAFTGIINITTDPRYRGRGFGTAITARAVTDGLAAGSSWCWLQSSAQGYPIYKSYGFQLIESWPIWVSQP